MGKQKQPEKAVRNRKILPFYEKYMMTMQEAAVYFHIGEKKMKELISLHDGAKWMLISGNRRMIKTEMFAKWLDQQTEI